MQHEKSQLKKVTKFFGKELRKVEKGIKRFEKDTRKFNKRVQKSPITRFGRNLSNSITREIIGQPIPNQLQGGINKHATRRIRGRRSNEPRTIRERSSRGRDRRDIRIRIS